MKRQQPKKLKREIQKKLKVRAILPPNRVEQSKKKYDRAKMKREVLLNTYIGDIWENIIE